MLKKLAVLGVCVVAAVGLTGCPGTACFGIDTCQLQGTWEESVTVGNTTTVVNRLVIKDDTFDYSSLAGGVRGTYKINALTNPKQIDLMRTQTYLGFGALQVVSNTSGTSYGIYTVSKDTLVIQSGDGASRPVAFDADNAVTLVHVSAD